MSPWPDLTDLRQRLRGRVDRMFPRNAPVAGRIVLGQRRLYILPTQLGLAWCVLLMLMFAGAVNYNLSLGYAMLFWLVAMMLVSSIHANLNLAGLELTATLGRPTFAGEAMQLQITVRQPRTRLRPLLTLYQGDRRARLDLGEEEKRADLALPTERRGRFVPGRVTLETRYPLGLFRCWTYLDFDVAGLVWPAPERNAPPLQPSGHDPQDGRRVVAGSDDFAGLRDYRAGDALRLIAWRQSARNDDLLSRLYQSQHSESLWLDWNGLPNGMSVEARLSRLCRWVLDADEAGLSYGLRLPTVDLGPDHGPTHRERCLAALALFQ